MPKKEKDPQKSRREKLHYAGRTTPLYTYGPPKSDDSGDSEEDDPVAHSLASGKERASMSAAVRAAKRDLEQDENKSASKKKDYFKATNREESESRKRDLSKSTEKPIPVEPRGDENYDHAVRTTKRTERESKYGFKVADELHRWLQEKNKYAVALKVDKEPLKEGKRGEVGSARFDFSMENALCFTTHARLRLSASAFLHTGVELDMQARKKGVANVVDVLMVFGEMFGSGSPFAPRLPFNQEVKFRYVPPEEVDCYDELPWYAILSGFKDRGEKLDSDATRTIKETFGYYEVTTKIDRRAGSWSEELTVKNLSTIRAKALEKIRFPKDSEGDEQEEHRCKLGSSFESWCDNNLISDFSTGFPDSYNKEIYIKAIIDGEMVSQHLFRRKCNACLIWISSGNVVTKAKKIIQYLVNGSKFRRTGFDLDRQLPFLMAPKGYLPLQDSDQLKAKNDDILQGPMVTGIQNSKKLHEMKGWKRDSAVDPFFFTNVYCYDKTSEEKDVMEEPEPKEPKPKKWKIQDEADCDDDKENEGVKIHAMRTSPEAEEPSQEAGGSGIDYGAAAKRAEKYQKMLKQAQKNFEQEKAAKQKQKEDELVKKKVVARNKMENVVDSEERNDLIPATDPLLQIDEPIFFEETDHGEVISDTFLSYFNNDSFPVADELDQYLNN